jgi:1-acyl-sn-glycerol-3-phosphate acyltransferase
VFTSVEVKVTTRARQASGCAQLDVTWARAPVARVLRAAILLGFFGPALSYYTRRRRSGLERLAALPAPVVIVANHSSHIDTPILLRALPRRWRRRTTVAAAADYFYRDRSRAWLVSLVFNTVPVQREGGGTADLEHVDRLLDDSWSLLVYPGGTRARGHEPGRLHTGAAVLAAHHRLAVVPVHLSGTRTAMPPGQIWPRRRLWQRRHPVRIAFGEPIHPASPADRHETIEQVQAFFAAQDSGTRSAGDVDRRADRDARGEPGDVGVGDADAAV